MEAPAHLSKIKIMVDSDVVINWPHGRLLVASAELGLHVTRGGESNASHLQELSSFRHEQRDVLREHYNFGAALLDQH